MISGDDDFHRESIAAIRQKLVEFGDFFGFAVIGKVAAMQQHVAFGKRLRGEDVRRNVEALPPIGLQEPMGFVVRVRQTNEPNDVGWDFG